MEISFPRIGVAAYTLAQLMACRLNLFICLYMYLLHGGKQFVQASVLKKRMSISQST